MHKCIWLFFFYWHANHAVVDELTCRGFSVTWLMFGLRCGDWGEWLSIVITMTGLGQVLEPPNLWDMKPLYVLPVRCWLWLKFKLIVFLSDVLGPHLQGLLFRLLFRNEADKKDGTPPPPQSNCFHPHWWKSVWYTKKAEYLYLSIYVSLSLWPPRGIDAIFLPLNCSFSHMKHRL